MSKGELIRSGQQRDIYLCQKVWVYLSTFAVFAQSGHTALLALKDGKSTKKTTKQSMLKACGLPQICDKNNLLPIQKKVEKSSLALPRHGQQPKSTVSF